MKVPTGYAQLRKSAQQRKADPRASWNSTLPKSTKRPKKVNASRKQKEFLRAYGSKERVAFVQLLPCSYCQIVGFSQNAHTKNDGRGRKGDYTTIAPLCGPHLDYMRIVDGCHARFDRHEILADSVVRITIAAAWARATEQLWRAHTGQEQK